MHKRQKVTIQLNKNSQEFPEYGFQTLVLPCNSEDERIFDSVIAYVCIPKDVIPHFYGVYEHIQKCLHTTTKNQQYVQHKKKTQVKRRPITMGHTSALTGPHAKKTGAEKRKYNSFHQTEVLTLDDDHIGRNMFCHVMQIGFGKVITFKSFIKRRVARKMIKQ